MEENPIAEIKKEQSISASRPSTHLQSVPPNPATAEHVLLSGVHGTLPRTDHMLDHKTYLKKFK